MEHLPKTILLNSIEIDELRFGYKQGLFSVVVLLLLSISLSWPFIASTPDDALISGVFIWSPALIILVVTIYSSCHAVNYLMDIRNSKKSLLTGYVKNKFQYTSLWLNGNIVSRLVERTRYYIVVDGKRYSINAADYHNCTIGNRVEMYVTPFANKVSDISFHNELQSLNIIYSVA
jgi:hypothetical protein